jgi:signal transduction histidine kinase
MDPVRVVADVLGYVVNGAFVLLGVVAAVVWLRNRDATRGYLALALGMLGLVTLVGLIQKLFGVEGPWVSIVSIAGFQMSGLALLLFRHRLIPLSRSAIALAVVALASSAALIIYAGAPAGNAAPTPLQSAAALYLVVAWSICVAEPAIRLIRASRGRPVIQRRRLRALATGYIGIIVVLFAALVAQSAGLSAPLSIATSVVTLGLVPILYVGFSPPGWLRQTWRESEEADFRQAVNELLLYSPTRAELAERALAWAVRLLGADFAFIIDGNGEILAAHGTSLASAAQQAAHLRREGLLPEGPEVAASGRVIYPMPLESGTGYLAAFAGPFTPLFGAEEVSRLRLYSASITAALDRAHISERLLALEDAKTRFLKIASHELRGPLTLVKGYLSMMEDGSIPADAPPGVLNVMISRVDQMSSMLTQMLETSRMEDERTELNEERFDLREALAGVVEIARPVTEVAHELRMSAPDSPVEIVADKNRVELILSNILDNAIKYSPHGGRIEMDVTTRDGTAIVAIRDEGIGIAKEDMGQLFTRFGRIANDETTAIPGTGLGLYLARELARMQQGDVTAESQAGTGSVFSLELPLAEKT